jgi:soluble lytic murein transglycosylase
VACLLLFHTPAHALSGRPDITCESAEACYRAALAPVSFAGIKPPREAQVQAIVERLSVVREQFPGSVWAARAALLTGVLLRESDPAASFTLLEAAKRDVPVIDDYIRLWTGETLLRAGQAGQAAALFESIPEAMPDTLLGTRAAYRGGTAWYMAGDCKKAGDLLRRAVSQGPQDPGASAALLNLAACQARENQETEAQATLRQLWVNYPQMPEAREAEARLTKNGSSEPWRPSPDDLYGRALAFFSLALNEEAVTELRKFLSLAPFHPSRTAARMKLGTALVRLKRYDQARQVFQEVAAERGGESAEATVWLARIYLRQNEGERLLVMPQSLPRLPLTAEQKAAIHLFAGTWQDDQEQYDAALAQYEQAAKLAESAGQKTDALWRIGWIYYRTGRFAEAVGTFRSIIEGKEESPFTPQALYWTGRALDRLNDPRAADLYQHLCRQYVFTYYCQLAQSRISVQPSANSAEPAVANQADGRAAIQRDIHYQRAVELRLLSMEPEAAAELAWLVDHHGKNREVLLDLSLLLSEAGAYNQALRVARANFRDLLEKGGDSVPPALWTVAYPTAYLPDIRQQAGGLVDPYLVAAIIREESQYDARAVSRVGAVGLMQVMPATAQAVARRQGFAGVAREDLFDRETNIRFGIHYLEQLLQQFNGNAMYAVAAYNAGPQAVTAWIAKHGGREPDEFVELIPYQETRQYVKKVLRSYREYHRLAGPECGARFLDKAC